MDASRLVLFLVPLGLMQLCGCGVPTPPPVVAEPPDGSAPAAAMELYDTNRDGFLDAKELEKAPGLKVALSRIDTDHDGKISQQEIAERIKSWTESKLGRAQINCEVRRNGHPLAGAKVVFVPEKFLGGTIQSGSGTTSARGTAVVSAPYAADPTVEGLSPGFYRVEITKNGDKIPAKYNAETTLGAEVAIGRDVQRDFIFELQY